MPKPDKDERPKGQRKLRRALPYVRYITRRWKKKKKKKQPPRVQEHESVARAAELFATLPRLRARAPLRRSSSPGARALETARADSPWIMGDSHAPAVDWITSRSGIVLPPLRLLVRIKYEFYVCFDGFCLKMFNNCVMEIVHFLEYVSWDVWGILWNIQLFSSCVSSGNWVIAEGNDRAWIARKVKSSKESLVCIIFAARLRTYSVLCNPCLCIARAFYFRRRGRQTI